MKKEKTTTEGHEVVQSVRKASAMIAIKGLGKSAIKLQQLGLINLEEEDAIRKIKETAVNNYIKNI